MSAKHPQGTFTRSDNGWAVRVETGQGHGFGTGTPVTVHLKSGALKQVTLAAKIKEQPFGNGRMAYIFEFTNGWTTQPNLLGNWCENCGDTGPLDRGRCADCQGNS